MKYDRRRRPKAKGKKKQACEKKGPRGIDTSKIPPPHKKSSRPENPRSFVLPFAANDLNRTFLRFNKESETSRGFTWKDGVNVDHQEFDKVGSCCSGGLYFTDTLYMGFFLKASMDQDFHWVRLVFPVIDDTRSFVMDPDDRWGHRKWRSKTVFAYPRRSLSDMLTWVWLGELPGASWSFLMHQVFYQYAMGVPELLISRRKVLGTSWEDILTGVLRATRTTAAINLRDLVSILQYIKENAQGGFPWGALDIVIKDQRCNDMYLRALLEFRGGLITRLSRSLTTFFSKKSVDAVRMSTPHMYTSEKP